MPQRRRKAIKKDVKTREEKADNVETEPKTTSQIRPRNVRGRRGSLADLPKMPLDVILEVLAYMVPLDLLYLARTSRDFRALLMSRDSLPYWKAARRNVDGLPDCPELLSEPGYASLMYETHCMGCLKRNVSTITWGIGARLCGDCLVTSATSTLPDYPLATGGIYGIYRWFQIMPDRKKWRVYNSYDIFTDRCLKSEVAHFERVWNNTSRDKRVTLLEERKATIEKWPTVSRSLQNFVDKKKATRSDELAKLRQSRQKVVLQKLRDLGWGDEIEHVQHTQSSFTQLLSIAGAKEPKELSERTWTRIRPLLVDFLEQSKKKRNFQTRQQYLRPRFLALQTIVQSLAVPFAGIFPGIHDFVLLPRVREIVDSSDVNALAAKLEDLQPELPGLVAGWKADATSALVAIINHAAQLRLPLTANLDNLAIGCMICCTVEGCPSRTKPQVYPSAIVCGCDRNGAIQASRAKISSTMDDYAVIALEVTQQAGHHFANWCFQAMKCIIETFGLDPLTATVEEMDSLDVGLVCSSKGCQSIDHAPAATALYNWRSAFQHAAGNCQGDCSFALMSDQFSGVAVEKARELQRFVTQCAVEKYEQCYSWRCRLCTSLHVARGMKETVVAHCQETHKVEKPGHDDYYVDPSCLLHPFSTSPSYLISREASLKSVFSLPDSVRHAVASGHADWEPVG